MIQGWGKRSGRDTAPFAPPQKIRHLQLALLENTFVQHFFYASYPWNTFSLEQSNRLEQNYAFLPRLNLLEICIKMNIYKYANIYCFQQCIIHMKYKLKINSYGRKYPSPPEPISASNHAISELIMLIIFAINAQNFLKVKIISSSTKLYFHYH